MISQSGFAGLRAGLPGACAGSRLRRREICFRTRSSVERNPRAGVALRCRRVPPPARSVPMPKARRESLYSPAGLLLHGKVVLDFLRNSLRATSRPFPRRSNQTLTPPPPHRRDRGSGPGGHRDSAARATKQASAARRGGRDWVTGDGVAAGLSFGNPTQGKRLPSYRLIRPTAIFARARPQRTPAFGFPTSGIGIDAVEPETAPLLLSCFRARA